MSIHRYPALLSTPVPGAMPCFRLPEFDLAALSVLTAEVVEGEWSVNQGTATASSSAGTASTAVTAVQPLTPALPLFDMRQARKARLKWTPRCTQLLVAKATECTNAELVTLIEVETGLRFSLDTVNTRRALLGLEPPGRNQWTSPLRRWRPWQGGKPS